MNKWMTGIIRTGLVLTVSAWTVSAPVWAEEQRVADGVYIEGTDVSGMTQSEVKNVIQGITAEAAAAEVSVVIDDQTDVCTLGDLGLSWSNTELLDEICRLGTTGNIVQRYKDQQDLKQDHINYSLAYQVDEQKVEAYAQSLESYNTEPVDATIYTTDELTPGVSGGSSGITLQVDETAAQIIEAADRWQAGESIAVEAVIELTEPDVTYEEMAMISDVLGSATTDYSASSYARSINVENGCSKISGTLLRPGEYFSVTQALIPFNAENGYEQAPSYEENRVVDSYGGGICQVSTTLYNAVLKAELEVTERNNHTMVVSYVPLSKDAAIAEGVMDLCFCNTLDEPVYIIGYCYGGEITFNVYGHETRPANRTLEFESRTISTIEPTSAKLYPNTSQAVGYISQTQSSHTGYTAELWKNIYYDGVLSESVQVNSSYYTAVGVIYDIGVMTDNTALQSALYTAISANDLTQVQSVIAQASSYQSQTEAAQTDQSTGNDTAQNIDQGSGDWDDVVVVQ